jgi:hypothetical protein
LCEIRNPLLNDCNRDLSLTEGKVKWLFLIYNRSTGVIVGSRRYSSDLFFFIYIILGGFAHDEQRGSMDRRLRYKSIGRRHPDESGYECCDTEKEEVVVETGWLS